MRLLVFDNGLIETAGHHRNEAIGFLTSARRRGLPIHFLIRAGAEPGIVDELGATPAFRHSVYDGNACGWLRHLVRLRRRGRDFADDCCLGMEAPPRRDDVIFLPNATNRELYGLFLWLRGLPRSSRPAVFANFVQPHFLNMERRRYGAGAPAYALALRLLGLLLGDRLVLVSNSRVMASYLQPLAGRPVEIFPVAKYYPDRTRPVPAPDGRVTIVFLGNVDKRRVEKGAGLLPAIVETVAAARPASRFVLQVDPELVDPASANALARLSESGQVSLLTLPLSHDEYFRVLDRGDIVILPYLPHEYWAKTSGIFCEAAALGKVSVLPEGTWMAEMLGDDYGAGVTFAEATPSAISRAIIGAIDNLAGLAAMAGQRSTRCRSELSVDHYFDLMLRRLGRTKDFGAVRSEPAMSMAGKP